MEILNTTMAQVQDGYTWGWSAVSLFGTIVMVLSLIFVVAVIVSWIQIGFDPDDLFPFLACLVFAVISIFSWSTKPVYREVPEYYVTIDETVSFHEVLDKYDVIEQNGDIYILRDKGWESTD